jgi:hypothetical protein
MNAQPTIEDELLAAMLMTRGSGALDLAKHRKEHQ